MKPSDIFTREEMRDLLQKSDMRGALDFLTTYGLIVLAFVLVTVMPNPFSVIVALILLGNRHLALAVLVHDAAHKALFRTKWLNEFAGKWLAAAPSWLDLEGYRQYHMRHHKYTGLDFKGGKGDPDIILTRNYPMSAKSMRKWIFRDLSGKSAPRLYLGLIAMKLGIIEYDLSGRVTGKEVPKRTAVGWLGFGFIRLFPSIFMNLMVFVMLWIFSSGWWYLLWIGSMFTTFQLFTRFRSIAEHGMLPRVPDMLKNTRTVEANWVERLTFAPCHVNYHLEHHFMMAVPSYNLPRMHKMMKQRGALIEAPVVKGYTEVLKLALKPNTPYDIRSS